MQNMLMKKPGEIPNRLGVYIEVDAEGKRVSDSKKMRVREKTGKIPPTHTANLYWLWLQY